MSSILRYIKLLVLAIALSLGVSLVYAWTGPTAAPPNANTPAPINVGTANQTKTGGLLSVFNLWVDAALGVTGGATFGGNVGVGTAGPAAQLHIQSPAASGNIATFMLSGSKDTADADVSTITARNQRWSANNNWAQIAFRRNGADEKSMIILRPGNAGVFVDALAINYLGNVGIGTTGPGAALQVNSASVSRVAIFKNPSAAWAAESNVLFTTGDPDQGQGSIAWINRDEANTYASQFQFRTVGTNAEPSVKMVLNASGNVGIGKTNPAYKLDVVGDVNVTGCYKVAGVCIAGGGQWTTSGTNIYNSNTGNVGIGTTIPASKLSMGSTNADFTSRLAFYELSTGNSLRGIGMANPSGSNYGVGIWAISTNIAPTQTNMAMFVQDGGNVGIGTTGPAVKLDVGGEEIYLRYGSTGPLFHLDATGTGGRDWSLESSAGTHSIGQGKFGIRDMDASAWRLVIDSSGNVGIGTTNPTSKLYVNGEVTVSTHLYTSPTLPGDPSSSVTTKGYVDSLVGSGQWTTSGTNIYNSNTGNVGIGTADPQTKLDITGASASGLSEVMRLNGGGAADTVSGPQMIFDTNYAVGRHLAGIGAIYTGYGVDYGGTLVFSTNAGASAGNLTEKMRIDKTGNVGIGTASPEGKLHAYDGTGSAGTRIVEAENGNPSGLSKYFVAKQSGSDVFYVGYNGNMYAGGNVGIGTTNPSRKFSLTGDATIIGNTYINPANVIQWEGGQYWTWRVNGSQFEMYRGDTGVSPFYANSSNQVIMNQGNVGIGTASPGAKLQVAGNIENSAPGSGSISLSGDLPGYAAGSYTTLKTTGPYLYFAADSQYIGHWGSGGISARSFQDFDAGGYYVDPGSTSVLNAVYANVFYYNSDESLKKDIKTIPNALSDIQKLRGVEFNWKESEKPDLGVIAQEVEKVYPELVSTNPSTGLKGVEYAKLIGPLIEAIKELAKKVEVILASIFGIKDSIAVHNRQINALQAQNDFQQQQIAELQKEIQKLKRK